VLLLVLFASTHWETIQSMVTNQPEYQLAACFAIAFAFAAIGITNQLMLGSLGFSVPVSVCFFLATMTNFANQFIPFHGGTVLRAQYLKKLFAVDYTAVASSFTSFQLTQIQTTSVIACSLCLLLHQEKPWFLAVLMLNIGMFSAASLAPKLASLKGVPPIGLVKRLSQSVSKIHEDRGRQALNFVMQSALKLLDGLIFFLVSRGLGLSPSFTDCVLITCVTSYVSVVRLTPNNVGIQEAFSGAISSIVSLSPLDGVLIVATTRLLTVAVSGFFTLLALFTSGRKFTALWRPRISDISISTDQLSNKTSVEDSKEHGDK
jgi:uncharacterized membrane protein YbhN (UPF0104 family)